MSKSEHTVLRPHTIAETKDRLSVYGGFDDDTLTAVAKAADWQNKHSFAELQAHYGMDAGPQINQVDGEHAIETLEVGGPRDRDPKSVVICHIPFANSISDNWVMHAVRLAGALEDQAEGARVLMVVGSPGAIGTNAGKLTLKEARTVAGGDLAPTVRPTLHYLESQGIREIVHTGYSFGAEKALTAVSESGVRGDDDERLYEQSAIGAIAMSPVAVQNRTLPELTAAFGKTRDTQRRYIEATRSAPYMEFWDKDNLWELLKFSGGMARLSNLAIAQGLTHDRTAGRIVRAQMLSPDAKLHVTWGSEDELAVDARMQQNIVALNETRPNQLSFHRVEGMYHAGVDDIDLFAAVMLQGLKAVRLS